MALTIPCTTSRTISIDDFTEYVRREVDLRDENSIASAAAKLRELANDRNLIVRKLNRLVEAAFKSGALASTQAILLSRTDDFLVRANVWPSTADIAAGRVFQQDQFSYNIAHDHNFTFLTVNYDGPGYETDIYEYDSIVEGYVGEPVDLRFLEKVRFGSGMVMLYRANRDAHIQYPPKEMTVTLNLVVTTPDVRLREQFAFDLQKKVLLGYPPDHEGSRRVSIIEMAAHIGNMDTVPLLADLSNKHPCRRTRLAALEGLERLAPEQGVKAWEKAASDSAPLVARTARKRLELLKFKTAV
jgi:hypothetical protein